MSIDTQISSFLIPATIWMHGTDHRGDLAPLARPARDALDIERRARKDAGITNEARRYTICCERIQSITVSLSQSPGLLPAPMVWPAHASLPAGQVSARAYLALVESVSRTLRTTGQASNVYTRLGALFFPPEHIPAYAQMLRTIIVHPHLENLLGEASKLSAASNPDSRIDTGACRQALELRLTLVEQSVAAHAAIVDVIELRSGDLQPTERLPH